MTAEVVKTWSLHPVISRTYTKLPSPGARHSTLKYIRQEHNGEIFANLVTAAQYLLKIRSV